MIVDGSERSCPRFDLEAAKRVFDPIAAAGKELAGERITSPFHAYSVETLRDRHSLRKGLVVPADVFVFGKGEPPHPASTKVGGRPFWPQDRPWPRRADGAPFKFLAQFNFSDSLDLVGELPGRLLLLLVSEDWWLSSDISLEFVWLQGDETPTSEIEVPPAVEKAGPFWGAAYRTADYPNSREAADRSGAETPYYLATLYATKIGGRRHDVQFTPSPKGRFLCQLGSISAAPDVAFPWLNREGPLTVGFGPDGIYDKTNKISFHDVGIISLFLDPKGKLRAKFEC
jgi:hypothetical protein